MTEEHERSPTVHFAPTAAPRTDLEAIRRLSRALRPGDDAAYEEVHRRLRDGILRFFWKRTRGLAEQSDELSHRTWIAVWRSIQAGRYDASRAAISTYVYAVACHVWQQHRREMARRPAAGGDFEQFLSALAGAEDLPDADLMMAERLDALRACLNSTDERFRLNTDERRIVDGLAAGQSQRDLAAELGTAASTIHARKELIFARLRECLRRKGLG